MKKSFLIVFFVLAFLCFSVLVVNAQTSTPRPTFQPTCTTTPSATPVLPVTGLSGITSLTMIGGLVLAFLGISFFFRRATD
ncbi:hypothetical protein ISS85_01520 [Candidatus Microgenomates bacterium]|nr:hypothetical protein [Candidatus Microgenomates bacterium]